MRPTAATLSIPWTLTTTGALLAVGALALTPSPRPAPSAPWVRVSITTRPPSTVTILQDAPDRYAMWWSETDGRR
jgi:hypothetical protein